MAAASSSSSRLEAQANQTRDRLVAFFLSRPCGISAQYAYDRREASVGAAAGYTRGIGVSRRHLRKISRARLVTAVARIAHQDIRDIGHFRNSVAIL